MTGVRSHKNVVLQSRSMKKRLRIKYVVTNCEFSIKERGEETKTGVRKL
jgi:hypothetical protein